MLKLVNHLIGFTLFLVGLGSIYWGLADGVVPQTVTLGLFFGGVIQIFLVLFPRAVSANIVRRATNKLTLSAWIGYCYPLMFITELGQGLSVALAFFPAGFLLALALVSLLDWILKKIRSHPSS